MWIVVSAQYQNYLDTIRGAIHAMICSYKALHSDIFPVHEMDDPVAFAASSNLDIMYLYHAIAELDKKHFLTNMDKKLNNHNGH